MKKQFYIYFLFFSSLSMQAALVTPSIDYDTFLQEYDIKSLCDVTPYMSKDHKGLDYFILDDDFDGQKIDITDLTLIGRINPINPQNRKGSYYLHCKYIKASKSYMLCVVEDKNENIIAEIDSELNSRLFRALYDKWDKKFWSVFSGEKLELFLGDGKV